MRHTTQETAGGKACCKIKINMYDNLYVRQQNYQVDHLKKKWLPLLSCYPPQDMPHRLSQTKPLFTEDKASF